MFFGFDTFIRRWLEKANTYDVTDLGGAFDKFISLYIIFNALYEEAYSHMVTAGSIDPKKNKEEQKAVCHIATFLGHDQLARELRLHSAAISKLVEILEKKTYYFNVKRGSRDPDWDKDAGKLRDVQSTDQRRYSEAILNLEYRARCNLFHGAKGFDDGQKETLRALIELLEVAINMTASKLGIAMSDSS